MYIAKLVFIVNGQTFKKINLSPNISSILVGRSSKSDVQIDKTYISGQHCEINTDSVSVFVKDIGSTNGTYINGKKINPQSKINLNIGDVITFAKEDNDVQLLIMESQSSEESNVKKDFTSSKPLSATIFSEILDSKKSISIGRSKSCDIIFENKYVSREHAYIEKNNGFFWIRDNNSTAGTYVNGKLISGKQKISLTDIIEIGGESFTLANKYQQDNGQTKIVDKPVAVDRIVLGDELKTKNKISIGRKPSNCDIQLNDKIVSKQHAEITKEGNKYFITDLGSTNGTYLNGELIKKKTEFTEKDEITIGFHAFNLKTESRNLSKETAIRADNIVVKYPGRGGKPDYIGLKKMSINIPHKAFVALMGPSGCGKSTLLKALNGDYLASEGNVYIHGYELKNNFDLIKRKIGYVPQDDIVHRDLTVYKSLYYAAKLRLPDGTSEQEIDIRIDEVLNSLRVDKNLRNNRVSELSGGQRKRISIAVELLTRPTILFLDEPTSPLDPETIEEFLTSIRNLTELDMTVVMVTHKPDDLKYVDKVIFLGEKGYHAFYGEKSELTEYFGSEDIINVYSKLSIDKRKNETEDKVKDWYKKYYQTQEIPIVKEDTTKIKKNNYESLLRQYYWLTFRYFNLKIADKQNMGILMFQPILIAILLGFIFNELQLGVLFMMAVSAIWFGVNNAAKEIVGELPIYKRERMFNVNILTYLASKLTVLSAIAFVQVTCFVLIVYAFYSNDVILLYNPLMHILFMFYISFSATLLGLVISAVFDNTEKVMTVVPLALIPQIILAGVVARIDKPFKELLSYMTLGRWGTEGLARIQNSNPDFEKTVIDTFLVKSSDKDAMGRPIFDTIPGADTTISYESVYTSIPKINIAKDTLILDGDTTKPFREELKLEAVADNPLDLLGFYDKNSNELLKWFDSFDSNIFIITIINIVTLLAIYIFMKKKDSI